MENEAAAEMKKYEWHKCYQSEMLKTIHGLKPEEAVLFMVIHFRVFECDGPCPDSLTVLVRRTGINRKRLMAARDALLITGKIAETKQGLVTRESLDQILDRYEAQPEGGPKKETDLRQKDKEKQQTLPLREEDKKDNVLLTENVTRARASKTPKPALIAIPDDWTPKPAATSFADQFGLTAADVDLIAVKMRLSAIASGTLKENWDAHFKSWIVKEWEIRARDKAIAERRAGGGNRGPSLADIAMGQ